MAFIGKTYKYVKNENFKDFLEHLKIPSDKIEYFLSAKPTQKLDKDGDSYVLTTVDAKTTEIKFKDGVQFDETVTEGLVAKTTFTLSGNVLTQVQKYDDGRDLVIKRVFNGDDLAVEITATGWDGVAHRYYSAA